LFELVKIIIIVGAGA